MSRALASLAAAIALCLTAAPAAAGAGAFRDGDVRLLRVKCGLCHGLRKTLDEFPGTPKPRRAEIVEDMAGRKPGWISDSERAAITSLLATDDFEGLAAALERPKRAPKPEPAAAQAPIPEPAATQAPIPEPAAVQAPIPAVLAEQEHDPLPAEYAPAVWRTRLAVAHGAFLAAVFFALGIGMALSGLKRISDRKGISGFPGSFVWKRHVLKGKITVLCALAGLGEGLAIWALDGFAVGAAAHFAVGCAVGLLFAAGGLTGLRMARVGGTPALRGAHRICNLTAIALFAANVASGLSLVVALLG